jgi:hypothetical protein
VELTLALDRLVVNESTVQAIQIAREDLVAADSERTVPLVNEGTGWTKVTVRIPAD